MPIASDYINGDKHLVFGEGHVNAGRISASWANGHEAKRRLDACNRAFCIYYHARQTLNNCTGETNYKKMKATLDDCLTNGWGPGVTDLKETFKHYADYDVYSDNTTCNYTGGNGSAYLAMLIRDMPKGPANFLNAINAKLPELGKAAKVFQSKCEAISTIKGNAATDWAKVRKATGEIADHAKKVEALAFLMPSQVEAKIIGSKGADAMATVKSYADGSLKWVNRGVSFVGALGKITDGIKIYDEANKAFDGDEKTMLAFAGLSLAVNHVPIVGLFYGPFIQKIPGLVTNWKGFSTDYAKRHDNSEAWLKRDKPKPAWKCPICKSSGNYLTQ